MSSPEGGLLPVNSQLQSMRTEDEIVRAHDRLVGVIVGDVPCPDGFELAEIASLATVLCWVLHHDHNQSFEQYLTQMDRALVAQGFILERSS